MLDLTESDYDALYVVVKEQVPRIGRDIFPKILAQLVGTGVLAITVTDTVITVTTPAAPRDRHVSGGAEAEVTLGRPRNPA